MSIHGLLRASPTLPDGSCRERVVLRISLQPVGVSFLRAEKSPWLRAWSSWENSWWETAAMSIPRINEPDYDCLRVYHRLLSCATVNYFRGVIQSETGGAVPHSVLRVTGPGRPASRDLEHYNWFSLLDMPR